MATYLLTWNPKRTSWDDPEWSLEAHVFYFQNHGECPITWSCGNRKQMDKDDRVWFIRQGENPRGLFARGMVVTPPYEGNFLEEPTKTGLFVDCQIDWIVNPETDSDQIIPRRRLDDPPFNSVHWDTQRSGISIPDEVARALLQEWLHTALSAEELAQFMRDDDIAIANQEWSRLIATIDLDLATPDGDVAGKYRITVPASEEECLRAELATHPEAEYGVLDGYADHLGFDLKTDDWDGWTWRPRQQDRKAVGQEGNELQQSGKAEKSRKKEDDEDDSTQFKEIPATCFEGARQTSIKPLPALKAPRTKIAPKQPLPEPTGQPLKPRPRDWEVEALHIAGKATWWLFTATVYTLKALLQATWWMIRMTWRVSCKMARWTFYAACGTIVAACLTFGFVMWLFGKFNDLATPKKME